MHAENLGSHNGCDGEAVEDVNESFPSLDVTPSFTFVVKTID